MAHRPPDTSPSFSNDPNRAYFQGLSSRRDEGSAFRAAALVLAGRDKGGIGLSDDKDRNGRLHEYL